MPLAGGTAEEILADDDATEFMCSRTAGGACVLNERRGNALIASLLDPIKGRGPKILEARAAVDPAISPDGRHIAFVPGHRNRVRILDLHGATESEITVSGAQYLATLDWSADGTGFFSGDIQPAGTRLLHIQRDGASQVLWTQPALITEDEALIRIGNEKSASRIRTGASYQLWGIESPDGRHLATLKTDVSANVWMVENP
jgi:hypothetical protein